jgi:cytochrome c biogenesis protein CcdA
VEVFVREDCKHCHNERDFLVDLSLRRDDFKVYLYDIDTKENKDKWTALMDLENLPKVTPVTLVGNTVIQGFDAPETTGARIESLIDKSLNDGAVMVDEYIAAGGSGSVEKFENGVCDDETGICTYEPEPMLFTVPFIGAVDLKTLSLPTLSVLLGFIDGFNPCAMWVLITFLVVLAQIGSRKKMWQVAGIFILAESIMYYLILNVWFTAWDFVKLDNIVTPIIGVIAVGAGLYFLYDWKTNDGTCKVTNAKQKAKTRKKIHTLVEAEMTALTVLGVIGLALSVNIIEFACSVGIPQTFTKVIELNNLNGWETQLYMIIYILFYMIDDFIVFGIALYSFDKIGITTKYAKVAHLLGGIMMIVLGLILIIDPSMLTF